MTTTGNDLQRLAGGVGCDIVSSTTGVFNPRRGRIFAMIVREVNTNIEYIKEVNGETITTVTSRSYIGGESTGGFTDLLAGELIIFDYPVTEINLTAGSVMVYYEEYGWKHIR